SNVSILWLERIASMNEVIMVLDVGKMDKQDVVDSMNKSMVEHQVRFSASKEESAKMEAQRSYQEMESLFNKISQEGEVVKEVNIRLVAHAGTIGELEEKVNVLLTELTSIGFRGSVCLNETSWEWQSLFLPYDKQVQLPNKRVGRGMPAESLSASMPYHFSSLNDPNGSYLGQSFTGGSILYDLFHRDAKRRFYNGVVVGKMGSGKSTLLKKLTMDNASRGNFIRGIDVVGEFETLVGVLDGKMISLDGSQGIINPLQVYRTVDNRNEDDYDRHKDDQLSFMEHISKVSVFYRYISITQNQDEVDEFERVMRGLYQSLGFGSGKFMMTELTTKQYPTFSDFLVYLRNMLFEDVSRRLIRSDLSVDRSRRLEKIELVIDNLVNTYGHLFDGHTTIPDFAKEQVVFFSIRNLTGLDENIFNAQLYNSLNLIWDNLLQNGAPQMKQVYEDPNFDEDMAKRLLVIIDEAHHLINENNMLAVDFLTKFAREARKYFGGLLFASQSINDFVPDYAGSETVGKIKTLFELT